MLPKLSELFSEKNAVIQAFLARLKDPYGFWYPVYSDGSVRPVLVQVLFRAIGRKLGNGELTGLMPMMSTQPVRGTEEVMLLKAYDEELHGRIDIKNEEVFCSKRRSFGPSHPDLRGFGCIHFYGGLESSFDKSSLIQGPMYAGHRCTIRSSAKVIGPALLGDDALLNTSSVLTRSILGSRSRIDDLVAVKDSIIGTNVYIKKGAKLLHCEDLEGSPITVEDRRTRSNTTGKKMVVQRRNMGCVIGDNCVIGANAVLEPGTVLMPGVRVPNNLNVPSGIYDQWGITHLIA